jgi:hypothetical protein
MQDPAAVGNAPESATAPQEVESLRDRLFGVALFFSGLEILFEGQPQMLDTYRRQCRNLIQRGYAALDQADHSAGSGPAAVPDLAGGGVEAPEIRQLLGRADVLVAAYAAVFPGRNRSEALSREETLALMEAAALRAPPSAG